MSQLVSICVPVYNGVEYLRSCLDSILNQTHKNLEVLIVDDCSTDDSIQIINEYLSANSNFKYFRNEKNLGLVGNWNKCIALANGEWIKFLFQDDKISEDCIETFLKYVNEKTPLMVSERYFDISGIVTSGMEARASYYNKFLPTLSRINIQNINNFIDGKSISNASVKFMSMNIIGEPSVSFFRKSCVLTCGYFNDRLDQICDFEFFLRIASKYGIVNVPHQLSTFRIHKNSVTNKNIESKYYDLAYLEPVKLAHLFLFDDQYADFRKNISVFNKFKLKYYFQVKGYEAWKVANSDQQLLEKFNLAQQLFIHLSTVKKPSSIIRIIYFLVLIKRRVNRMFDR
jgi:glycosyltransferase involved in cell wall biosynthesis